MEELRQTAITYYKIAPAEIRVKVDEFFDIMDVNKDGTISFFEFSSFMSEEGYNLFNNPSFFNEISTEMTNDLNWGDVVTLFYIIQSGRPLCDGCRRIIKGLYFTCETCFKENGSCFDLHQECLAKKQYIHKHANFIDNFALLHFTRKKRLADMKPARIRGITDFKGIQVTYLPQSLSSSSSCQEIQNEVGNPSLNAQLASILAQQHHHRKRKATYRALEKIIAVASIASGAGCTIM